MPADLGDTAVDIAQGAAIVIISGSAFLITVKALEFLVALF